MKFSCVSSDLVRAMKVIAGVMPKATKNLITMTFMLKIERKSKELYALMAHDGITVSCLVRGVTVIDPGAVVLKAEQFSRFLSQIRPEEEIVVESGCGKGKNEVEIRAQFLEYALDEYMDAEKYPALSVVDVGDEDVPGFTVGREAFLAAVEVTKCLAFGYHQRFALNGVSFWPVLGDSGDIVSLNVVATDAKGMMATSVAAHPVGSGEIKERDYARPMILLNSAVGIVGDLFGSSSDELITVGFAKTSIVLKTQRDYLQIRLPEGAYPRWDEVMKEKKSSLKLSVPAGEFIQCARLAAICSCDDEPAVVVEVGEGFVRMSSIKHGNGRVGQVGMSRAEIPVGIDGEGLKVGLYPKSLFNVRGAFDADEMIDVILNPKHSVALIHCDRINLRCALATTEAK